MKEQGLLHGPFVADLPNAKYLDLAPGAPATLDFTVPVEGMESPWRLAKFVFVADTARAGALPPDMAGFVDWAKAHPGRMTHPNPANFMGATFLKQALVELATDPAALQQPVTDEAFLAVTEPLWAWYDALRPNLWREGTAFPENESIQNQMLNDGEIDLSMSFDPASTAAFIEQGLMPETARVFVPKGDRSGICLSSRSPSTRPIAPGPRWLRTSCLIRRRRPMRRTSGFWAVSRFWTPRGWTRRKRRPSMPSPPPRRCRGLKIWGRRFWNPIPAG
ncbi:hypothetical protein ACFSHQ_05730 [Gemmobacter lanyuensis]